MLAVSRTTDTVLMVRPYDFGFNEQTKLDNEFQQNPRKSESEVNRLANVEFDNMVGTLRSEGINVLVLEKPDEDYAKMPDAVFPNNWFSTEHDGTIILFPMAAENRREERRPQDLEVLLRKHGYKIRNVITVGGFTESANFLEGTGSMVIDHRAEVVYAARSPRCNDEQFDNFIRLRFYEKGFLFNTNSSSGRPVYHTNVMLSIGDEFAVVCSDCIYDPSEKKQVTDSLQASFDVIEITMDQMEKYFCGNILQVNSGEGNPRIVMSQRAHKGFTPEQLARLRQYGKIVPMDLETIETVGGGSARCMMAEVFSGRIK